MEDFSLYGGRKINTHIYGQLLLVTYDPNGGDTYPYASSSDDTQIVFLSGHIYNLDKLAEIFSISKGIGLSELPQYFANNAEKFLSAADGIFSLVYYNALTHELIIANDTFGLYPLFYYEDEDFFIFSNEFEPITRYKYFNNTLDQDAIAEYFALGSPLAGKTFFKKIRNLLPTSILTINSEQITQKKYDIPQIAINYSYNADQFAEQIATVFHNAVQARMAINGKKYCMLTGGLDTRLILSNLDKEQRSSTDFITFKTPGLDPAMDKDVIVAKMIADKLSLNHFVIDFPPWLSLWNEEFSLTFFDIWREHHHELVIGGIYGGEFLTGTCFEIIPKEVYLSKKRKFFLKDLLSKKNIEFKKLNILSENFIKGICNPYETLDEEINKIKVENKILRFAIDYLTRGFFTQIYGGLRSTHAMPYGFTAKMLTPFLDNNYLNVLLSIPDTVLLDERQRLYNTIYKNFVPELNNIPTSNIAFVKTESNCIRFIEEGLESKNIRVFRNSKLLNDLLTSESAIKKNIYDRDFIMRNCNNLDSKIMKSFFDFESWCRKYISYI